MTSLGKFVFISNTKKNRLDVHQNDETEEKQQQLLLAYENLQDMPSNILGSHLNFICHLDLSHNKFKNLDFLSNFPNLESVILDHNLINSSTIFPELAKLELLWLNHNQITELDQFIYNLRKSLCNLRFLSLMGNSAAPSYLNGGSVKEYVEYRLFVISWFDKLVHLDDRVVTDEERGKAEHFTKWPLLQQLPLKGTTYFCMKILYDKLNNIFKNHNSKPVITEKNNSVI